MAITITNPIIETQTVAASADAASMGFVQHNLELDWLDEFLLADELMAWAYVIDAQLPHKHRWRRDVLVLAASSYHPLCPGYATN